MHNSCGGVTQRLDKYSGLGSAWWNKNVQRGEAGITDQLFDGSRGARSQIMPCYRVYRDDDSVATLVHAFVASRVDYCGSLLIGAPRKTTDKLQRVLNSAARIVSNTRKFDRDSLISGEVSYNGWTLSTEFGSEFASRCSDVCTRWLLNTCLPTAKPVSGISGRRHLRSAERVVIFTSHV